MSVNLVVLRKLCKKLRCCSGKIYTDDTNFTRPPVVTVATNLNSVWFQGEDERRTCLRETRGSGSINGTWATCEYVWHISGLPFYHRAGQEQYQTIIWCAILHLHLQRLHYSLHCFLWHISGLPIHTVVVFSSCELESRFHVLDRGIQWYAEVSTQLQ